MSQTGSYFARLKDTLEGVVAHLTTKGIERHHLAFGGEGEKRKTRVPTDANSEFLANRAMGDWAEQVLAKAIDSALSERKAVPYGNSDRMAAGEEGFREFYLAGVEETRVHGKRPDLLLFDVKVVTRSDLSCLKHTVAAEFVRKAVAVDGPALCRMFNQAISGQGRPTRLSTDQDPLFQFHRWQANLRILDVETVQTVPQVPWSHPFIERLIATIRREYLDRLFFWSTADLERKLELFKNYYNAARVHEGLSGDTPGEKAGGPTPQAAGLENYRWQSHCHGLFELPIAA